MFERGRIYRRRDLHAKYGGQPQGGISTPSSYPWIFLFTGDSGEQYGYRDGWEAEDLTFRFTGEGQVGEMGFQRGNRAIVDHTANGEEIYLFKAAQPRYVEYIGQFICGSYEIIPNIPDRDGNLRSVIVFRLLPVEPVIAAETETGLADTPFIDIELVIEELQRLSIEEVRRRALDGPAEALTPRETRQRVFERSAAVRLYALSQAAGICGGCLQLGPFLSRDGQPFLEVHHLTRLSDGGPDHPANVIALCPNCHRRAHFSRDRIDFNKKLQVRAKAREQYDNLNKGR